MTLTELDAATADTGLRYMVHPGELSSSVGGNVGTNAGGMRAVKYGVARHNVLGLQAALPTGEIIRTGGKIAKVSTGYDLTQLIVGSEGTLALATEVIVKLHPRLDHSATVLAPFADFDQVMEAVPKILASGLVPYILEYIDNMTMAALVHTQNLELGFPTRSGTAARRISLWRLRTALPTDWTRMSSGPASCSPSWVPSTPMCSKELRHAS